MPLYRLYRLDNDGRFSSGEWVDAETDDQAIAAARERYPRAELWQGDRLVGRIGSEPDA